MASWESRSEEWNVSNFSARGDVEERKDGKVAGINACAR
jgi:hypothetical protein